MAMPPPFLLVWSCVILYLAEVAVAMSGADAGLSQVSLMKTASGAWIVMVSQSSVVYFPSERALIRMQLISSVLVSALLAGVWDVAWPLGVAW